MPEAISIKFVDSDVIAELFGVTPRRVQQLAKEGVITFSKQKGGNRYDQMMVAGEYIRHLSDKVNNKESKQDAKLERDKLQAEIRLKQSRARMSELHLNELEGKMHRSEDVEALTSDLTYTIRNMIDALPGRLAVDLADIQSPAEVSVRIQKEVRGIMRQLANYRYDPKEYSRRVRDREGWSEPEDDEAL